METLLDSVRIVALDGTATQQYNERLKTLLLCIEGTVPGTRAFGLPADFLDLPTIEAANRLAAELQDKIDLFIPEITIAEIGVVGDITGKMRFEIRIEERGETG